MQTLDLSSCCFKKHTQNVTKIVIKLGELATLEKKTQDSNKVCLFFLRQLRLII